MTEEKRVQIFTERMKELREEKGKKEKRQLTQAIASKEMGIHVNSLINYEFDRFPKTDQLIKIKNYYKVSYEYLLGESDSKVNNFNYRKISDVTGLSDYAIEVLEFSKLNIKNSPIVPTINFLLEQEESQETFEKIREFDTKESLDEDESIEEFEARYDDIEKFVKEWEKNHFPIIENLFTFFNTDYDDIKYQIKRGKDYGYHVVNKTLSDGTLVVDHILLAEIQDILKKQKKQFIELEAKQIKKDKDK